MMSSSLNERKARNGNRRIDHKKTSHIIENAQSDSSGKKLFPVLENQTADRKSNKIEKIRLFLRVPLFSFYLSDIFLLSFSRSEFRCKKKKHIRC